MISLIFSIDISDLVDDTDTSAMKFDMKDFETSSKWPIKHLSFPCVQQMLIRLQRVRYHLVKQYANRLCFLKKNLEELKMNHSCLKIYMLRF